MTKDPQTLMCPVSVRCVAMLADDHRNALLEMLRDWRRVATSGGTWLAATGHPDLTPLWSGLLSVGVTAKGPRAFLASVVFDRHHPALRGLPPADPFAMGATDPDYASRRFSGFGLSEHPDTILAALLGRPMTAIVDHPLFEGMTLVRGETRAPFGPGASIPVDDGVRHLVAVERDRLLEAAALRTTQARTGDT